MKFPIARLFLSYSAGRGRRHFLRLLMLSVEKGDGLGMRINKMMVCGLVAGAVLVSAANAKDFYVSLQGSDDNAGTLSKPFRTVVKARDAVRKINKDMKDDIHVYIRGGVYYLTGAIELGSQDSGFNGHRVIYCGYKDERPQLVGGVPVTGWKPWKNGIMRADVGKDTMFWALIVSGRRAHMAGGKSYKNFLPFSTRNVQGYFRGNWMSEYINITGFDEKQRPVMEFSGSGHTARWPVLYGYYKFVKNPGDWALDSDEGFLYFYPEKESDLKEVLRPTTHAVFRVAGESRDARVKDVSIENMKLEVTDFNSSMRCYSAIVEDGYNYSNCDWPNTLRTALVSIENANNIQVRFCELSQAPITAVSIYGPAESNVVYGCRISDIGYVGVYLAGYKITRTSPLENKFNRIENNEIFDIAGSVNHTSGVTVYQSADNYIAHNMISHSLRYAISVKGIIFNRFKTIGLGDVKFEDQWKYLHTNRNRIVGNYIFDMCRSSLDAGGIETWGAGRDNMIASNIVVNAYMAGPHKALRGRSIFLDDGSNHWTVYDNVAWNTRLPSLNSSLYACGVDEVISNNVFDISYTSEAGLILNAYAEKSRDHVIERNIMYSGFDKVINKDGTAGEDTPEDIVVIQSLKGLIKSGENNLISLKVGKPVFVEKFFGGKAKISLEQWCAPQKDRRGKMHKPKRGKGIKITDPRFVNAAEHDYRLREDSPAWDMGIHSIAMDEIGLYADYPFRPVEVGAIKLVSLKANGKDVFLETEPGQKVMLTVTARTEKWFTADLSKAKIKLSSDNRKVAKIGLHNSLKLKKSGRAVITVTVTLAGVTKSDTVVIYSGIKRGEQNKQD